MCISEAVCDSLCGCIVSKRAEAQFLFSLLPITSVLLIRILTVTLYLELLSSLVKINVYFKAYLQVSIFISILGFALNLHLKLTMS